MIYIVTSNVNVVEFYTYVCISYLYTDIQVLCAPDVILFIILANHNP